MLGEDLFFFILDSWRFWGGDKIIGVDIYVPDDLVERIGSYGMLSERIEWVVGSSIAEETVRKVQKIIRIEIYVLDDLMERIGSHDRLSDRIEWVVGLSIEEETVNKERNYCNSRNSIILLDSYHTHDHVLKELQLYSQYVGKGCYLICGDTIVENIIEQKHRTRESRPGNNPKTALIDFLEKNDRYEIDKDLENKLLFTCNPDGYLKPHKDL